MLNMIESNVANRIHIVRNLEVMLDSDIAELYGVETKCLNRQVKRHQERFDEDFTFQLSDDEFDNLKCQIGTAKFAKVRTNPNVFTEQGVYMLATVVNSDIAAEVTKSIMRTFTKLRQYVLQNKDIYSQLETLKKEIKENKLIEDQRFESVKNAIVTLENMILEIDQSKSIKQVGFIHQGDSK